MGKKKRQRCPGAISHHFRTFVQFSMKSVDFRDRLCSRDDESWLPMGFISVVSAIKIQLGCPKLSTRTKPS